MKKFEEPILEVTTLVTEDVSSNPGGDMSTGDGSGFGGT